VPEGEAASIEDDLEIAGVALTLFGDDDFSLRCRFRPVLVPRPVQQENEVGIIFDLPRLSKIAHMGRFAVRLRRELAELAKKHKMTAFVLRQLRQSPGYGCDFGPFVATLRLDILGIVDTNQSRPVLANRKPRQRCDLGEVEFSLVVDA
jgi:hypothetical protein